MTCPKCDSPYGLYVSHRKKNDIKFYKLSCKDCDFVTDEWIDETNKEKWKFMFDKFGINPYNEWDPEEYPEHFKKSNFTTENAMNEFEKSYRIIYDE